MFCWFLRICKNTLIEVIMPLYKKDSIAEIIYELRINDEMN